MTIELTENEEKAIKALKRALKNWPDTLEIFAGGYISIRKPSKENGFGAQSEVDAIPGVPCSGGDGGDDF